MIYPDDKLYSERSYVAPTTYTLQFPFVSNWNYYGSLQDAIDKRLYIAKKGGRNVPPIGNKTFLNNQTRQTFGINCDFYIFNDGKFQLTSYGYLKSIWFTYPMTVYRFYTTSGDGPYYAILDPQFFGIGADVIENVSPEKLEQLDGFYREVQLLKYRYNSLVGFLSVLSKRKLNSVEQQIFNEGMLLLNNLNIEISRVPGLEIEYSEPGKIGLPVILFIAIIAIVSAAAAWTVSSIVSQKEKTKRINDSYELQKWVASKKEDIARLLGQGEISKQSADSIYATLDNASSTAAKIAESASKGGGFFESLSGIVKWGAIGLVGYMAISAYNKNKK